MGEQENLLVDLTAEGSVLGAILVDGALFYETTDLTAADFGKAAHAMIYEAMASIVRRSGGSKPQIDHLTVTQILMDKKQLGQVGGPAYLMSLDAMNFVALAGNVAHQVRRIKDLSLRRQALATLRQAAENIRNLQRPAEEVVLESSGEIAKLGHADATNLRTAADFSRDEVERIHEIQEGKAEKIQYVPTGIELWDETVGGIPCGVLTVIGAHPGVGKTALAETMQFGIAERGEEVGSFMLEDAGNAAAIRWIAEKSRLAIRQLRKPGLSRDELARVHESAASIDEILQRIYIDDRTNLSVARVAAKMRQLHARRKIRVFFVDHLLEMLDFGSDSGASMQRDLAVGQILRVLRDVAKDLNVAVVLLSHLVRQKDTFVDVRHIRPLIQHFAGGSFVDRMSRLAVGLWCPPKPKEPTAPKDPPEPKRPAKVSDDEYAAIMAKYVEAKEKQIRAYARKRREWEEGCELAEKTLAVSVVKHTEGKPDVEFTLTRLPHAGLIRRRGGERRPEDIGYSMPEADQPAAE